MSSTQHLAVSPRLPTALAGQARLELPGCDVYFTHATTLLVIPTELDVSRFNEALSRVLQIYPHAAGKFRYIEGRWTIELANVAIPLDIEHKLDSSSDSILNGDWVGQDDLSPFIVPPPPAACVSKDDTPLISVKLTFFDNETCIGIAWHHSLGDGMTLFHFLHTLSQFYQGLSAEFATPSFERYHFPAPSDSVVAEIWPRIPHLHETCSLDVYLAPRPRLEHVWWRMDRRDIEELRSVLSARNQNGPSLSRQDCITAYLVAILNSARTNPLPAIRYICGYRHVKAPFVIANAASHMTIDVVIDLPSDIARISTAVRRALMQSRDPEYIYRWVMLTNSRKLEIRNAGTRMFPFFTYVDDNLITVNSLSVIDWQSAHFGCPGARFYTARARGHYIKINKSNPVKGADGVWRASQSVDISLGVAPEVKPKLLDILALGVRHMLHA